ncbi:MAG: 50S ribosomal protein L23 [Candidatus Staskawiczbacteria bacterium]|nr:50S ribosomal protein L23 [Candidatus Staskawiczbacteria bacterium]
MALLDFLKRKEEVKKSKKAENKSEKVSVTKPAEKKPEPDLPAGKQAKATKRILTGKSFSYEAVKDPHISEKATYLSEKSQYIFKVSPNYNKNEIRNAVEGIYGVDVLSVNIIKIPPKKRRIGKTQGFKKGLVKAIVKIKEGQKIEIL